MFAVPNCISLIKFVKKGCWFGMLASISMNYE